MIFEYTLLTTLAFHHLVIGVILIAGLLLLNRLTQQSAEAKSWLWMTAFILSTVIPFTLLADGQTSQRPITITATEAANLVSPANQPALTSQQDALPSDYSWHLPGEIVFNFSTYLSLAIALWLIGTVWRAAASFRTINKTKALFNSHLTLLKPLSADLNIDVYSSNTAHSPMVVGLWKSKIILPENVINNLQDDQLIAIVLHEKAHIQRKDNWFSLLQELIAIIFWWSPVIRFLSNKIHIEREIACDLRAASKMSSKQYAQSLVDCARLMVDENKNVLAMSLFSKKKELNDRVNKVLKHKTFNVPRLSLIAVACLIFGATTLQAAQSFSPKISIKHTADDARFYSTLSRWKGEQLLAAVKANDLAAINSLLADGVNINTPIIGDGTALMIAVKRRDSNMVRELISLGADVNQASIYDGNPLIIAAKTNNIELANLLINEGANINGIVRRDETPLINASNRGHLEMTKLLVERGADVNLALRTGASDGFELRSPLNRARNSSIKESLLANGAIE